MTYQSSEGPVRLRLYTLADCDVIEANPQTPENDSYDWFGFRVQGKMRREVESGEAFPAIGATTGYQLSWLALLVFPMLAVIQLTATQVGAVSGCDLVGLARKRYGRRWAALLLGSPGYRCWREHWP